MNPEVKCSNLEIIDEKIREKTISRRPKPLNRRFNGTKTVLTNGVNKKSENSEKNGIKTI